MLALSVFYSIRTLKNVGKTCKERLKRYDDVHTRERTVKLRKFARVLFSRNFAKINPREMAKSFVVYCESWASGEYKILAKIS